MLTLYAIPLSLYCAKLRILLRHKQLEWRELPPPGGYGSAEYKVLVPSGNLPALVDGDWQLADSEAIAEYLEQLHPEPAMLPDDPRLRAKVRERSRFHDTRLEPELRRLFPCIDETRRDPAVIETQAAAIDRRLRQLAVMLERDPEAGKGELTLGDCGLPITMAWIDALQPALGFDVEVPGSVAAYLDSNRRHAAVAEELESYRPRLTAWLQKE